jgi:hypothetical protein
MEHALLPTRLRMLIQENVPYCNCTYSRLPEDEPSGSKHAEDIKIKN